MSQMSPEYDHLFRIKIIGDSRVGKSCLLLRHADDIYTESYISTIGVDFKIRTLALERKTIKLQIWDTPAPTRPQLDHFRGCHAYMIAFDITDRDSFDNARGRYLIEISREGKTKPFIFVGCKADCEAKRAITSEEIRAYCEAEGFSYIEVSAKTGVGVEEAFSNLAREVLKLTPSFRAEAEERTRKHRLLRELNTHIQTLETEITGIFNVFARKNVKLLKREQLIIFRDELSRELDTPSVREKVHAFRAAHPFLDQGKIWHRTRDIFDKYDPPRLS
jgi:Ras-related protein Rab-1A